MLYNLIVRLNTYHDYFLDLASPKRTQVSQVNERLLNSTVMLNRLISWQVQFASPIQTQIEYLASLVLKVHCKFFFVTYYLNDNSPYPFSSDYDFEIIGHLKIIYS